MNQQQHNERIAELRLAVALWTLVTIVIVAFPVLWTFLGCILQVCKELDEFPLPYTVRTITIISIPVAIIFGLITWKIQNRLTEALSDNQKGEVIKNPAFVKVIGREMK